MKLITRMSAVPGLLSTWDFWIGVQKDRNGELFSPENDVGQSFGIEGCVRNFFVDNISTVASAVERSYFYSRELNVGRPLCIGCEKQKKILTRLFVLSANSLFGVSIYQTAFHNS